MKDKSLWKSYLALLLLWSILAACNDSPKRSAHIQIPDGYVGWVRIEFGVPNTPALKTDSNGWEFQRVLPSGLLQTSSEPKDMNAVAGRDYSYYSSDHLKPLPESLINGWAMNNCFAKPDGSRLEKSSTSSLLARKQNTRNIARNLNDLGRLEVAAAITSVVVWMTCRKLETLRTRLVD